MGHTRVIFTDATTAEAATVLKGSGFLEASQGGLYICPSSPVKAYVVWGRSSYFPEMLLRLDFPPRVQIHLKSREDLKGLTELAVGTALGLRTLSPGTKVRIFDAERAEELPC